MFELLEIYLFAFILCPIVSSVLTILGTHLTSRSEGLQLMALSQAALVGNIFGHFIVQDSELTSFICSIVLFVLMKYFFSVFKVSKEHSYIVAYLCFVSLSYFLTMLFPSLDSHFAVGFFGDIVSISEFKAIVYSVVFLLILIISCFFYNSFLRETFDRAVMKTNKVNYYQETVFMLAVLSSLFGLGFLFTLSFMIFPVVIAGQSFSNFKVSLIVLSVVSAISSVTGLGLSIAFSRVATVPAQVLVLVCLLFIMRATLSLKKS